MIPPVRCLPVPLAPAPRRRAGMPRGPLLLLASLVAAPAGAAPRFTVPSVPPFVAPTVNPNVLIMLDTSQSMDATMAGKIISGTDPGTRSNVARTVLRDILTAYRYRFNWGLGSFDVKEDTDPLQPTYAYYLGNASTMVYTDVCTGIVDGVGVSDKTGPRAVVKNGVKTDEVGLLPCIPNPEPAVARFKYLTFSRSGDDPDVNDVYYNIYSGTHIYGIGATGTDYFERLKRLTADPAVWARTDFTESPEGPKINSLARTFAATDSGWLPDASIYPRQVWLRRDKGFTRRITGQGRIDERVVKSGVTTAAETAAESTHYDRLNVLLAPEELSTASTSLMLKNAAQRTPLAGTLQTSGDYFRGAYVSAGSSYASPIQQSCQRNFVVLATDGNPTGKKDGSAYAVSELVNTRDPASGTYTFGAAAKDVFTEIDALRATSYSGQTYDVQTYVVGLGDTVANPGSVAALNEMARRGGTGSALLASSPDALKTAMNSIVSRIGTGDAAASSVALSGQSYSAGSLLYQAKFNPSGWTGDLLALPIGADGTIGTTPSWQAATQVTAQNWSSGRSILTFKPSTGAGIAFRWPSVVARLTATDLDKEQVDALNRNVSGSTDALGALRLAYLRGDASNETRNKSLLASFRNRLSGSGSGVVPNVLGDIVDSVPLYVGAPSAGYAAGLESASYPAFAATWANRTPYVYVGANDGMLHAFDAATGVEKFAYVPGLVYASATSSVSPLVALTSSTYGHQFTVNGSPTVGDAFYGGGWHSLLVSGLGYGAKGLYALDVTNPASFNEASAAAVVRWEFTDKAMGYVLAKPLVAKTNDGSWSVITGNGYLSEEGGKSRLFILDAQTGAVKSVISTSVGSGSSPNSISGITVVDIDNNGTADIAYAGDLDGNVWKFDLREQQSQDLGPRPGSEPPAFRRQRHPAHHQRARRDPPSRRRLHDRLRHRALPRLDRCLEHQPAAHLRPLGQGQHGTLLVDAAAAADPRRHGDRRQRRHLPLQHAPRRPADRQPAGRGFGRRAHPQRLLQHQARLVHRPAGDGRARRRRRRHPRRPGGVLVDHPLDRLVLARRHRLGDRGRRADRQPPRQRHLRRQQRPPDDDCRLPQGHSRRQRGEQRLRLAHRLARLAGRDDVVQEHDGQLRAALRAGCERRAAAQGRPRPSGRQPARDVAGGRMTRRPGKGASMTKIAVSAALSLLVLLGLGLGPGRAAAVRPVGDLPVPAARTAVDPPRPQAAGGVVTGVRATHPRGTEIEIDGRWWLVLRGRTSVLRDGRLLDERALAPGQAVRYAPATLTPGETALGFVQVP